MIGVIAIPGMMTGAILGGSSVRQAAMLQMIITFMISAATTLASIFTTIAVIAVTVDGEHRIRPDRIDEGAYGLGQIAGKKMLVWLKSLFCFWNNEPKQPGGAIHLRDD